MGSLHQKGASSGMSAVKRFMAAWRSEIAIVVFTALLLGGPSHVSATMTVWVDHGNVKVRQQGDYTGIGQQNVKNITLKCAKNEFEPLQIFVYANGETLNNVDVTISNLTSGANVIPSSYFTIYKQGYELIDASMSNSIVNRKSRSDYLGGYHPNILYPKVDRYYGETRELVFPFSVTNGNVQGVWVDLATDSSTPAGTYTGTYTVTADGKDPVTGTITLQVWNFAIPSTSTLKNIWVFAHSQLGPGHFGTAQSVANTASLTALYMKSHLLHRVAVSQKAGGPYFNAWPNSTTGVTTFSTNWLTAYKAALDGTAITAGPYAGAKLAAIDFDFAHNINGALDGGIDGQARYKGYLKSWWDYFTAQGWDPMNRLYAYLLDEPTPVIGTSYTVTPSLTDSTLKTATPHYLSAGTGVMVKSTVALPAPLQANTNYFVTTATSTSFQLAATPGGTPMALTSPGSGTVTAYTTFRGLAANQFDINYLKSKDMASIDTGGKGVWKNSFMTSDRNVTDDARCNTDFYRVTQKKAIVNSTPSYDEVGFWCPPTVKYEYIPGIQLPCYAVPRNTYLGASDWANNNHWSYVANSSLTVPQVDISSDTDPFWVRSQGWFAWTYKVTGMLYYSSNWQYDTLWPNPFEASFFRRASTAGEPVGNGQGRLFFPGIPTKTGRTLSPTTVAIGGSHDIPLETVRLKLWRETMEDREYMEILRQQGRYGEVDAIVNTLYTPAALYPMGDPKYAGGPYYNMNKDMTNLLNQREALANLIVGGPATAPAPGTALPAPKGLTPTSVSPK